jgi:hypothetical protein
MRLFGVRPYQPSARRVYQAAPFRNKAWSLDLMMLVAAEPGARERNEAEYRALVEGAGFRLDQVIRIDAPRDLIVARSK